ncbi:hypothetical protein OHA21_03880 [Actinoplanes sp. NBC_00393]|uniref:hypothetical protein n=1 Tax=Actinoplanes sp. NBC_00393 TaxID=2975953 RepID=UPI002E1B8195
MKILLTAVLLIAACSPAAQPPIAPTPRASVDGFEIGYLPAGLRLDGPSGGAAYVIEKDRLRTDRPASGRDEPTAAMTMHRYVSNDVGASRLWITVSRPEQTTAAVDATLITRWLVGFHTAGTELADEYDVPAGLARLIKHVGSETTVSEVVITAAGGAVISVSGPGTMPAAEIQAVAEGLRPL